MTDILKINREVRRVLDTQRITCETPFARIQREAAAISRIQSNAIKSLTSVSQSMARAFSIQPRLEPQLASIGRQLQLHQSSFQRIAKTLDVSSAAKSFSFLELQRIAHERISFLSRAYIDTNSMLQRFALAPSMASADHIAQTASLIGLWQERNRQVEPLLASISLTEAEVSSQGADIVEYPTVFEFSELEYDESGNVNVPTHNLYYVQRTELILLARQNPHILYDERSIDSLPTMQYFNLAQSICRLVTTINRQCAVSCVPEVFRPTNKWAESLVALPNLIAVTQRDFAEFIDYLYFIIYEGAGSDNLRFIDLIDKAEAEPVWKLKHLRNYMTRHDVEHGDISGIKKKQERLGQIFLALIDKPLPRTRQDYGDAQLAFVRGIEAFLRKISDRLEQLAGEPRPKDIKG